MLLTDRYNAKVQAGEINPDPAQIEALPFFDIVAEEMANSTGKKKLFGLFGTDDVPVKGLYLWGGVGRGKSMLMDLFFETVPEPRKRRVHFHAFMQEVHSAMHEARKTGVDDAIKPVADDIAQDVRLLCFDEMQISDITDAMIVGRLFENLFASGVVIVTTSNRVPDDLYKNGLNRNLFVPFIDLLKSRMTVHELASETDYRQDRLEGEQVYFSPANAVAKAKISDIWQSLTGGAAEPLILRVKGRDLTLPAFRNGIARASFFDLCGQPLGAADYLAVAENVRVLVLEDIPCLSRDNFNEAKRFVTLIDALYEGKVRLICSAAAQPERLYLEGEGVFEFERTASRLREMQAAEWGTEQALT
ncbi:cell division protein ZapE [Litoreibacter ascidiaceicola]|uniref:Cell division protein ZapE n=1 Tax=Litoreibacter ascidiaceicola TaxID=1486859 RepID=A0A1M5BXQ4_9RHOB|nr:cell division protein ZapE [Litoreibacter ascidiaceicola]SHF47196.1 cell division protein ZapE [Litoreibacter ascidiaceicola]